MKKYFKKITALLSPYKKEIFVMILILFVSAGLGYILPFISKNIVDKGLIGRNLKKLAFYCGISVAVSIMSNCCNVIKEKNV